MQKKTIYIVIGVLVFLLIGALIFSRLVNNSEQTNSNIETNTQTPDSYTDDRSYKPEQIDVLEGAPVEGLRANNAPAVPVWSKILPYFTNYYTIMYGYPDTIYIEFPSELPASVHERYKNEALDWLKSNNVPVETLQVKVQ